MLSCTSFHFVNSPTVRLFVVMGGCVTLPNREAVCWALSTTVCQLRSSGHSQSSIKVRKRDKMRGARAPTLLNRTLSAKPECAVHESAKPYFAKPETAKPYFTKPYSAKQESGKTLFRNLLNHTLINQPFWKQFSAKLYLAKQEYAKSKFRNMLNHTLLNQNLLKHWTWGHLDI